MGMGVTGGGRGTNQYQVKGVSRSAGSVVAGGTRWRADPDSLAPVEPDDQAILEAATRRLQDEVRVLAETISEAMEHSSVEYSQRWRVAQRFPDWLAPRERDGYSEDDYDSPDDDGVDQAGYDRDGYDGFGFDENGFDLDGYTEQGYDALGRGRGAPVVEDMDEIKWIVDDEGAFHSARATVSRNPHIQVDTASGRMEATRMVQGREVRASATLTPQALAQINDALAIEFHQCGGHDRHLLSFDSHLDAFFASQRQGSS